MGFFKILFQLLGMFLGSQKESVAAEVKSEEKTQEKTKGIDWTNPSDKVSDHFTVKELIWLPRWSRLANEEDGLDDTVKQNLKDLAEQMDVVRDWIDSAINVHVCYRPSEYNKLIGGAAKSSHVEGKAIDFSVKGMTCDEFREKVEKEQKLETWDMRMEDLPVGSNWIHLDIAPVKFKRFFKP